MRLQKYLARCGVASRRASEELIVSGRVTVNGELANQLGMCVDSSTDVVEVDGVRVLLQPVSTTIMLHKPLGYVSTMSDPQGRPCIAQLVPEDRFPGLFPIGRLDRDTSGLLLFSTDGELGNALLHPRKHVDKRYFALVEGILSENSAEALRRGVMLDDGMTLPASIRVLNGIELSTALQRFDGLTVTAESGALELSRRCLRRARDKKRRHACCVVEVVIHEGRKRQVRRMLREVGNPVVALHRECFGPVELGDLPEGTWRTLSDDELASLHAACAAEGLK